MEHDFGIVMQMIDQIKQRNGRNAPFTSTFFDVKRELRVRRKLFLGSDVSLCDLVQTNDVIDEAVVEELSYYLSEKSLLFWKQRDSSEEDFFFRFYRLTLYALCGKMAGESCVDDIILTAECLALSQDAFVDFMKSFLSKDMVGELFSFIEDYGKDVFTARFVDAVLGAVCVFLGVLTEPWEPRSIKISKEVIQRVRSKSPRPGHSAV